ncbi:thioredoxin family protein [Chitinophaga sp. HK235]|uniref:thioredoxin family protein n=1 Tax=Chitinophaga sp. HK235 TaxID=2952571 RepID=UPI001BA705A5|nr:thioredoxin family protein [Chitinophaga sp. HK235]
MRIHRKILLAIGIFLSLRSEAQTSNNITFRNYDNWKEIQNIARKENKLIFLDVYATWCVPCKKMEQEVYTVDSVHKYINDEFLSVKIQIDSNKNDNTEIQKMYGLASMIKSSYFIPAVPTFLFFDSNGNLIYQDQGYKSATALVKLCKTAKTSSEALTAKLAKFHQNKLTDDELLSLAQSLKSLKQDTLALKVAAKYKSLYIDKSDPEKVLPKAMTIINDFLILFGKKDLIIEYLYQNQLHSDSLLKARGFSRAVLDMIVRRDIIGPALVNSKKSPSWNEISRKVASEWDKDIADRTILESKIAWHLQHNNWDSISKYQVEKLDRNGIPADPFSLIEINRIAWEVIFKHSKDKKMLEKTAGYMKQITANNPTVFAFMDTYANLLYKLGKTEEAMLIEEKVINLAEKTKDTETIDSYKETFKKMKNGVSTWD